MKNSYRLVLLLLLDFIQDTPIARSSSVKVRLLNTRTLLIDGAPTAHISDALGHSSGAVTAHYLKTLPDAQYKRIGETLLEFK